MNPMFAIHSERESARFRRPVLTGPAGFTPTGGDVPASIGSCDVWVATEDAVAEYGDLGRVRSLPDRMGGRRIVDLGAAGVSTSAPWMCSNNTLANSTRTPYLWCGDPSNNAKSFSIPYYWDRNSWSFLWVGSVNSIAGFAGLPNMFCGIVNSVNNIGLVGIRNGVLGRQNLTYSFTSLQVPSNEIVAIVFSSGPRESRAWINTVENTGSMTSLVNGAQNSGGASGSVLQINNWYGRFYEFASFNQALTSQEAGRLLSYCRAKYATRDLRLPVAGKLVCEGDSTAEGNFATRSQNWMTYAQFSRAWSQHNYATAGKRLDTMSTDQASNTSVHAAAGNWLFVCGGINDLFQGASGATTEGRLSTYCNAAITAGFDKSKIVVFTHSITSVPTTRDDYNTLVRANYTSYAGWLVDIAADSVLGVSGTTYNDASVHGDGLHFNDAGQYLFAQLVKSTVTGLPA